MNCVSVPQSHELLRVEPHFNDWESWCGPVDYYRKCVLKPSYQRCCIRFCTLQSPKAYGAVTYNSPPNSKLISYSPVQYCW